MEKSEAQEQLEASTAAIGRMLKPIIADAHRDAGAGGQWGFALVMFDFGPGGYLAYASDGQRGDMIKALKELLDHMRTRTT